jgi:hypothetical protein
MTAASKPRDASARLVIYHTQSPPASSAAVAGCFARTALLMVGATCTSDTCVADLAARVTQATVRDTWAAQTGDWDVDVAVPQGAELHVHRTLGATATVVAREVDGKPVAFPPLAVNGTSIVLGP